MNYLRALFSSKKEDKLMMRCLRIRDLIRKTHEIKKSIPILDEDVNSAKIYLNQIKTEMYRLQMHINLDNIANESDEL